ncbi:hypothetical protein BDR04DRAFT_259367 [Suillus decipiens]|nr:hypothetical protein BDR04DRAFT_259367 [Suillus decipiens]
MTGERTGREGSRKTRQVSGQELRCSRLSGAWFYSRSSADVSAPHPIGLLWLALVSRSSASPPRALLLGFFGHCLLFSFRIIGIQHSPSSACQSHAGSKLLQSRTREGLCEGISNIIVRGTIEELEGAVLDMGPYEMIAI